MSAAAQTTDKPGGALAITVVLPAYNEAGNIDGCCRQISGVLEDVGLDYEFIFVDDGSTDATWEEICALSEHDKHVHGLRHRGRSGKAAALATGFMYSRGTIVVTCDADLQYDPRDVKRLIDRLLQGYDMVSAYKVCRQDPLSKRLPSHFFNFFVRKMTGVQLHDMNAGLKAYRQDAAHELIPYGYGELHRFFAVILAKKGYTVTEVEVEARPRSNGHSKYGAERFLRGAMDFLTVFFLSGYVDRPLHLLGGIGISMAGVGGVLVAWVAALSISGRGGGSGTLTLAVLLILMGTQMLVIGLIAEMINNVERGPGSRARVSEVIAVDRRVDGKPGWFVERRRPRAPLPAYTAPMHVVASTDDEEEARRAAAR
jgi:hypothetical protein